MTNESASSAPREERSWIARILFGFLWFVLIYVVSGALVGGIAGGIRAASATTREAAAEAGRQASRDVYDNYGMLIFLVQLLVFTVLCSTDVLPGVGKYKKSKPIKPPPHN
jgi:hypothetical protein